MGDKKGDSNNIVLINSELDKELSILVNKKVISSKIAKKLGTKLKEKNVKITKHQLIKLANKINDNFDTLKKTGQTKKFTKPIDTNMEKIVETIDKLDERLSNIESGNIQYKKSFEYVTSGDIDVAGWDMEPLLTIPNDPESIVVLMKWLQYLVDKCGHLNLPEILDYYVDIGWISDDAKSNIIDYSSGITDESKKGESGKSISNLPAKDHIQSLIFIQRLKGRRLDKHFLDRIDGEITRVSKKIENYKLK
jgi:archaellum component FlaD/FlaE